LQWKRVFRTGCGQHSANSALPHQERKPCEKKLYNVVKKKRGMTGAELAEKDSDGDFSPAEIHQAKPKLDMRMKMGVSGVVGKVAGFYKAS
jgi:hypothetical protein